MIGVLLEKEELSADEISELAKGKLKKKGDLLIKALEGYVTDHHRFLLKQHFAHIDFLAEQIKEFYEAILNKLKPYETEFKDIQSVTGVKGISAASGQSSQKSEMIRCRREEKSNKIATS